jgi:hypothetical protein
VSTAEKLHNGTDAPRVPIVGEQEKVLIDLSGSIHNINTSRLYKLCAPIEPLGVHTRIVSF